jgi:hypothetical protein
LSACSAAAAIAGAVFLPTGSNSIVGLLTLICMKFQNTIIPVILSGGYGMRLWPLSRKQYPKQYLPCKSGFSTKASTCPFFNDFI